MNPVEFNRLIDEKINSTIKEKRIKLHNLKLKSIPAQVFQYADILEDLDLYNNEIEEISVNIGKLTKLKRLSLKKNKISEIPDSICNLVDLKQFELQNNKLSVFPQSITEIISLEKIYFQNNKITKIQGEFPPNSNLNTINLDQNLLKEVPISIATLKNLRVLILDNNLIKILPEAFLNFRGYFSMDYNPIGKIPFEIRNNKTYSNNVNYYVRISNSLRRKLLFEAKVIVVGESSVGKTTLISRILNDTFDEKIETTHGINVWKWIEKKANSEEFRINIWDFGGQEIYHATHQFFLTKRSLYLFVWDARKDDNLISFDYWLNVIRLLGNNPSVVVVMNKSDESEKFLEESIIKKNFPNVSCFFKVSAKEGKNISSLKEEIKERTFNLPHIGEELPEEWHSVREELEKMDVNFISYSDFETICFNYKLNEEDAIILSEYFHDLGIILNFKDNHTLRDIIFLKPEWATNAVYNLKNNRIVINNYGRFNYDNLRIIWQEYPKDKFKYLLELMQKFELSFRLPHLNNEYIIPELLSTEKPDYFWDQNDNLRFIYEYNFMPKGIITRFIVRNHSKIFDGIYWKNGALISSSSYYEFEESNYRKFVSIGEITVDIIQRRIYIAIKTFGIESKYDSKLNIGNDLTGEVISRRQFEEFSSEIQSIDNEIHVINTNLLSNSESLFREINNLKIKKLTEQKKKLEKKVALFFEKNSQEVKLMTLIKEEIDSINLTLNKPKVKFLIPCNCNVCQSSPEPHLFDLEKLKISKTRGRKVKECENTGLDIEINSLLGQADELILGKAIINSSIQINNNQMKINTVNANSGSIVNIIENFENRGFIENVGIKESDQFEIIEILKKHSKSIDGLNELFQVYMTDRDSDKRHGAQRQIIEFINNNVSPLVQGVTSSAIFELLKNYFWVN